MEYSWFFLFVMIALCALMMRGGIVAAADRSAPPAQRQGNNRKQG